MAEFQEVMKNYERMCKEHLCTSACPMYKIGVCEKIGRCVTEYGIEKVEQLVMSWAAEHPEPNYPTWEEWLQTVGVMVNAGLNKELCSRQLMIEGIPAYAIPTRKVLDPIPADIAKRLGIEPKEG